VNNIHNVNHSSLVDRALSQLMLASLMMADDMDKGLAKRGLTRTRAKALWEIGHRTPVTQRDLADALKVTPRNVTALVDALEKDGFVLRKDHPTDRRAIVLDLSKKGGRVVSRMKQEAHRLAQDLFGNLEPEALKDFLLALDHVTKKLERLIAEDRASTNSRTRDTQARPPQRRR
jgi:DNA-binding MarR family transcriptional regulator